MEKLFIFKLREDRVLKSPSDPVTTYINSVNLETLELKNAGNVYRRPGKHEGMINCFQVLDNSIELGFCQSRQPVHVHWTNPSTNKISRSRVDALADTFSYDTPILARSSSRILKRYSQAHRLWPVIVVTTGRRHGKVLRKRDNPQNWEIPHLSYIFYSIAIWDKFKYYNFPNTDGIPGEVIKMLDWGVC